METEFNSYIFKPNETKNILEERKTLIGWVVFLIIILFFILEIYWVVFSLFFLLLAIYNVMAIDLWNKPERLKGSFPWSLTINTDEIKIGVKSYPMNQLSIDKLICYDYRGRKYIGYVFFVTFWKISNGTWNDLWFTHKDTEYRFRFLIDSEKQSKQLQEIKNELCVK